MAVYMVGYDLVKPGKDYKNLIDAIKTYTNWWHCLDSTWLIKSDKTAEQIRDHLKQHIDQNDRLLVANMGGAGAWIGFDKSCSDWLTNNL
jgi:hypothetical protein